MPATGKSLWGKSSARAVHEPAIAPSNIAGLQIAQSECGSRSMASSSTRWRKVSVTDLAESFVNFELDFRGSGEIASLRVGDVVGPQQATAHVSCPASSTSCLLRYFPFCRKTGSRLLSYLTSFEFNVPSFLGSKTLWTSQVISLMDQSCHFKAVAAQNTMTVTL